MDTVAAMLRGCGVDAGVLAGDLNLDLDLDQRHDLFSDDEYRDVESYNYVAWHMRDVGVATGSTAEPNRRIDYVFVSEGTRVRYAAPWKGRRSPGMDHDPLVVDLIPAR